MKLIQQRYVNDCGVACVAMLAGVTYGEAKEAIFGDRKPGLTQPSVLKKALKQLGRNPAERFIPLRKIHFSTLQHPALLKTNLRADGNEWHWVVWSGDKLLDPKNPPYARLRPISYLAVI